MTLREFLVWWRSQLLELIPPELSKYWNFGTSTALLKIESERGVLMDANGQIAEIFELPARDITAPLPSAQSSVSALPGPPQRLRVSLEPGRFLVRHLTLPVAAKAHLDEALGYQLPKLTPFATDEVIYSCGVSGEAEKNGKLPVWLVVVPKQQLAHALAIIGEEPPPNPVALAAPPEPGHPLEFSWRVAAASKAAARRPQLAWIGVLVLLVCAIALNFSNRVSAINELEDSLVQLRLEAKQVAELRAELRSSVAQVEWLEQRKTNTPATLLTLDTLTKILDDQTWLQRLDANGENLTLTGTSRTPSGLIESLETSKSFTNVQVDAFTRDPRNNANRFNLRAKLAPASSDGGES